MADGKCDFCSKPEAEWTFPCGDFQAEVDGRVVGESGVAQEGSIPVQIEGAWLACDDCKEVIEEGGVAGITDRIGGFYRMVDPTLADPALYARVEAALTELYEAFQTHRTGNPVQISKGTQGD